ncbi:unnamed protein product [Linum trigynum]|uniref:Uncharacterized protein n=1 Tax=Linum trigynum TaxID=586398 RepID=A0AAV2FNT1_9ROSI
MSTTTAAVGIQCGGATNRGATGLGCRVIFAVSMASRLSSGSDGAMTVDGDVVVGDKVDIEGATDAAPSSSSFSTESATASACDRGGAVDTGGVAISTSSMAVVVSICDDGGSEALVGATKGKDDNGGAGFAPSASSTSSSTELEASTCGSGAVTLS